MKKLLIILGIIVVAIIIFVLVRKNNQETPNFIIGEAQVSGVDIQMQETFPVGVNLVVDGMLPDPCTELGDIIQSRDPLSGDFKVTIQTRRPVDAVCADVLSDFNTTILLEGVDGLPAGTYNVLVNDFQTNFTLDIDNFISEFDPLK